MSRTDYPKDGQAMGEIRTPISLEKLQPYLEKNIEGFAGPVTVKQFGVSNLDLTVHRSCPGFRGREQNQL